MTKMKALNINPERTSNMIRTLKTIMITLMVKKMRMKTNTMKKILTLLLQVMIALEGASCIIRALESLLGTRSPSESAKKLTGGLFLGAGEINF